MTAYSNWLNDYPARALSLLESSESKAKMKGQEVTLLLSISSLLISVTYERLKYREDQETGEEVVHVARERYKVENENLVTRFDNCLKQPLLASEHLPLLRGDNGWKGGELS